MHTTSLRNVWTGPAQQRLFLAQKRFAGGFFFLSCNEITTHCLKLVYGTVEFVDFIYWTAAYGKRHTGLFLSSGKVNASDETVFL